MENLGLSFEWLPKKSINKETKKESKKDLLEFRRLKIEPNLKMLKAKDIKHLSPEELIFLRGSFNLGSMSDEQFEKYWDDFEIYKKRVMEHTKEKVADARERGEIFNPYKDPEESVRGVIGSKIQGETNIRTAREEEKQDQVSLKKAA